MKKILSLLMLIVIVLTITSCNKTSPSIENYNSNDLSSVTDSSTEPPSLDAVKNSVLELVGQNEKSLTGEAEAAIEEQYNNGNSDANSIYQYLCNNNMCIDSINSGILLVSLKKDGVYEYNSITRERFTVNLDLINPDSGAIKHIRTFSNNKKTFSTAILGLNNSHLPLNQYFNEDFSLMVVEAQQKDGAVHCGWIDEKGNFTDVSQSIAIKNDFGGLISHHYPRFYNGYFYFSDSTNKDTVITRVPVNDLSSEKTETIDNDRWAEYVLPDTSIKDNSKIFDYFDTSFSYPALHSYYDDWVSVDTCIASFNENPSASAVEGKNEIMLYKCTLNGEKGVFKHSWIGEKSPLIPEQKGRSNWNAVLSPEKDKVVFQSRLTDSKSSAELFTVSIDGGEPTKINTSYKFPTEYWVDAEYEVRIVDWF